MEVRHEHQEPARLRRGGPHGELLHRRPEPGAHPARGELSYPFSGEGIRLCPGGPVPGALPVDRTRAGPLEACPAHTEGGGGTFARDGGEAGRTQRHPAPGGQQYPRGIHPATRALPISPPLSPGGAPPRGHRYPRRPGPGEGGGGGPGLRGIARRRGAAGVRKAVPRPPGIHRSR